MDNVLQAQINNVKSLIDFKIKEIDMINKELIILRDKLAELEAQLPPPNPEQINPVDTN
jgi:peptidoglycan hydrolase CwlO-like protein